MVKNIKLIHPQDIDIKDLPMLVFSDKTSRDFISTIIKLRHKNSTVNHVMWLYSPDKFASQNNTYALVDTAQYMREGNRLLFFELIGFTPIQKRIILKSIERKLALPWYKKAYDYVGILGQALGIKWINISGLNYCSESVISDIKKAADAGSEEISKIIDGIGRHMYPDEMKDYLEKFDGQFKLAGYWDSDIGG